MDETSTIDLRPQAPLAPVVKLTSMKLPPGRRGGFGRQKGTPNKATSKVLTEIAKFLDDPKYQNNLMDRIEAGRAVFLENLFWKVRLRLQTARDEGRGAGTTQRAYVFYLPRNGREVEVDAAGRVKIKAAVKAGRSPMRKALVTSSESPSSPE